MRKVLDLVCSAARPTFNKAMWLKRKVTKVFVNFTKRSTKKQHMEIYGDRVRQYHIRRIRVVNRSGEQQDFSVVQNIPDGNCLFRAISQAISKTEGNHASIRQDVVNYITGSDRWKDYFPYIRGQHEHLAQRRSNNKNNNKNGPQTPPKSAGDDEGDSCGETSAAGISTVSVKTSSPLCLRSPPTPSPGQRSRGRDGLNNELSTDCRSDDPEDSAKCDDVMETVLLSQRNSQACASAVSGTRLCEALKAETEDKDDRSSPGSEKKDERRDVVMMSDNEQSEQQTEEEKNNNSDGTNEENNDSDEERELLRQEYKRYMLTEKAYGTLQELVAAAEFFKFNLVVFREIPTGGFNVQTFCESKYDVTHCFLFTGHQEDGHFELMDRSQSSKLPIEVFNGSYVQVDHSSKTGLVTIRDQNSRSTSKRKTCEGKKRRKAKGKKENPPSPKPSGQATPKTLPLPVSVVEIMAPAESNQAVKHSSSFYDIPCRLRQASKAY